MRCLSKTKGDLFYRKHIEQSSEFNDNTIISKHSPSLVSISSGFRSFSYFKPQSTLKEINLKVVITNNGMLQSLSNIILEHVSIKFNLYCLDVNAYFNTDLVRSILINANIVSQLRLKLDSFNALIDNTDNIKLKENFNKIL